MVFEYQLIRSARKTLGVQIKCGQIIVRAPAYLAINQIEAFLRRKADWLQSKIAGQNLQLTQQNAQRPLFADGSQLWVRGQLRTLQLTAGKQSMVVVSDAMLCVYLRDLNHGDASQNARQNKVKKRLECWFKEQANQYLPGRVEQISAQLKLYPTSIKIRHYKARWGSCNNRGQLSFNDLLMMLPDWVIDYVIVHELCHLVHLNHSPPFWQLVARYCPNYPQAKQWLKFNQQQLAWQ